MTHEVIEGEIVQDRAVTPWTPKFVEPIEALASQRDRNLEYMKRVLKPGVHYGVIPGTGDKKPSLLKPGAQALCRDLGLRPDPVVIEHVADVMGRDHNGEIFLAYNIRSDLYALRPDGTRMWVGAGIGSCNSWEERYRWRTATRKCPECGEAAIIRGKAEYGGGWVCFRKKNGCGAKFPDNAVSITSQEVGRIPNDRVMDLDNTIFKQAAKRALVEAVLNVTGASDVFTQDVDQSDEDDAEEAARAAASQPKSAPVAPPSKRADDTSGDMTGEQRASIDTLRMRTDNDERVNAAAKVLKGWGFKHWADFLVHGTQLQAAEIERVLTT